MNHNDPIKPDPKFDGIEHKIYAEHEITVNGYFIQSWEDGSITVDGIPSLYSPDYWKTLREVLRLPKRSE